MNHPSIRVDIACLLIFHSLLIPTPLMSAQTPTNPPRSSQDPIEQIKGEGMNRSQVMETLSYLTEVIGPRLTASPSLKRANEWTRAKLEQWGLKNAHLEAWQWG